MRKGAKFKQKKFKSRATGSCQSFQFFRQNSWFFENNGALPKYSYIVFLYLTIITKLSNQSLKPNFILTKQATLKHILILKYMFNIFHFDIFD